MKKISFFLFVIIFLFGSFYLYGKKSKKITPDVTQSLQSKQFVLDLTESVQSAENIETEAEYKAIAPMEKEPDLLVFKMTITPPNPTAKPPMDKKKNVENEDNSEDEQEIDNFSAGKMSQKIRQKIADKAAQWYKQNVKTADINGKKVNIYNDCSNFTRAVYWAVVKKDLFYESQASGAASSDNTDMSSGVAILYQYFKKKQRFSSKKAKEGDIIFFDNTYDRNKNQRIDDPNTHVAIVTKVGDDGTVYFIHGNSGGQIKEGKLNLSEPKNNKKNIYLKRKYTWDKEGKIMSGELTKGFGGF